MKTKGTFFLGFAFGIIVSVAAAVNAQTARTITTLLPIAVLPVEVVPAIVTQEYLISFQAAALDVFNRREQPLGIMSSNDLEAVTRFNSAGIGVLRGTKPETWVAVARKDWPVVRGHVTEHSGLSRWVTQIDAMLQ